MDRSFDSLDPAEVPPSPRAFVQYEENRRKETGSDIDHFGVSASRV